MVSCNLMHMSWKIRAGVTTGERASMVSGDKSTRKMVVK